MPRCEVGASQRDLTVRELQLPVGPSQRYQEIASVQDVPWRLGRRVCLLKECEQHFRPRHPFSRYCSSSCRAAARRWRRREANRLYRASDQGKCRRRAQVCRYRERIRQRHRADSSSSADGEGYPHQDEGKEFSCQRPGCYEAFVKTARSRFQKFCSAGCRQALRRVLIRERRWKRRLLLERKIRWRGDDSW
jgi:hypothetical protein